MECSNRLKFRLEGQRYLINLTMTVFFCSRIDVWLTVLFVFIYEDESSRFGFTKLTIMLDSNLIFGEL